MRARWRGQVVRRPGIIYSALVPNPQGLAAAQAAAMPEIAVFLSASESHNRKNVNKSIAETLRVLGQVVPSARSAGMRVRGYVSTVYGCPTGRGRPSQGGRIGGRPARGGLLPGSLGDTIGVANPRQVRDVLSLVLADTPSEAVAVHFHTRAAPPWPHSGGTGDGHHQHRHGVGRVGWLPVCARCIRQRGHGDVVNMLEGMGVKTGVDLDN